MATRKAATTKTDNNALTTEFDWLEDAGGGMEGTDRESFAIPFLKILQKSSPQVEEGDAAYIEGAKPGMLFNTVTQKLYKPKEETIHFIPAAYQRRFIRWAPRGDDAGFRGELTPEEVTGMRERGEAAENEGKLLVPTANGELDEKRCDRLTDTRSHFGLVMTEDGNVEQVVFPLSSTQIKKSKQLMSALSHAKVRGKNGMVTPPTWMNKIRLSTTLESNDQGSWYGVRFEPDGFIESKDVYDTGKALHEAILGGEAHADYAAGDEKPEDSSKF